MGQLLKPACPRAHVVQHEKPPQEEACLPRESPHRAVKIQHNQKEINNNKKEVATATKAFSNHRPNQPAAINIQARPSISQKIRTLLKAQMMVSLF